MPAHCPRPATTGHTNGTVIRQPGATAKDVTVISVEDAIDEPNETYTVALEPGQRHPRRRERHGRSTTTAEAAGGRVGASCG